MINRAPLDDLCAWFGIAASTGGSNTKQIRDMLRINQLDGKWLVPRMVDMHPLTWMISVNGYEFRLTELT